MFVKAHQRLVEGRMRGVPRASRWVLLELCYRARAAGTEGVLLLPAMRTDLDAVHDLLGGSKREIGQALRDLTEPLEPGSPPEVVLSGPSGRRVLTITSYPGEQTFDLSTSRTKRFRLKRSQQNQGDADRGNAFPNGSWNGDGTGTERDGTLLDLERDLDGERSLSPPSPSHHRREASAIERERGGRGFDHDDPEQAPASGRLVTEAARPAGVIETILTELERDGPPTARLATRAFAEQLAGMTAATGFSGFIPVSAFMLRLRWALDGVLAAANTGSPMGNPAGYVITKIRDGGAAPPRLEPTDPSIEAFLAAFDDAWARRNKTRARGRGNDDATLANASVTAIRSCVERAAKLAGDSGAWVPGEADVMAAWIAEYFSRESKIHVEGGWSLRHFVRDLGSFPMPRSPRGVKSTSPVPQDPGAIQRRPIRSVSGTQSLPGVDVQTPTARGGGR